MQRQLLHKRPVGYKSNTILYIKQTKLTSRLCGNKWAHYCLGSSHRSLNTPQIQRPAVNEYVLSISTEGTGSLCILSNASLGVSQPSMLSSVFLKHSGSNLNLAKPEGSFPKSKSHHFPPGTCNKQKKLLQRVYSLSCLLRKLSNKEI